MQVCALLHHQFVEERYHLSRVADPIVGVSFTGLYDFFAHAFGIEWLQWMQEGRPEQDAMAEQWIESEKGYLSIWRNTVRHEVIRYWRPRAEGTQPGHHRAACRHQELADRGQQRVAPTQGAAVHPPDHDRA